MQVQLEAKMSTLQSGDSLVESITKRRDEFVGALINAHQHVNAR